MLGDDALPWVVRPERSFMLDGRNGRHLCFVLPVLGPSVAELSFELDCRLTPHFARRIAREATRTLFEIHAKGLCHGDFTTGNLLLDISSLDTYLEDDIYRIFGHPMLTDPEEYSGQAVGPEAPRYFVDSIDFVSTPVSLLTGDVKLIDFDQCFQAATPPDRVLGTALDFLAPEVAVGEKASPGSDIWALGCCIYRLRAGSGLFSAEFEATCPVDQVAYIGSILGQDLPPDWAKNTLWDENGYPTKDPDHGRSFDLVWHGKKRSVRCEVDDIWDEPLRRAVSTGTVKEGCSTCDHDHRPFVDTFLNMIWKPQAIKVDNVYIHYYDRNWPSLRAALPGIPVKEADMLVDLLSKIFVYDPEQRPTAHELLERPWFQLDDGS